jgi:hypothetical protein
MPATSRAKVSNGTQLLAGVDGRSATFRRFRDLVDDLIAEQDRELSISEIGLIRSAAALLVRSEELQAAAVRCEEIDGDELIRLTSEARRLLSSLRTPVIPVRDEPQTLDDYFASSQMLQNVAIASPSPTDGATAREAFARSPTSGGSRKSLDGRPSQGVRLSKRKARTRDGGAR